MFAAHVRRAETGTRRGNVTPIGGLAFLAGWVVFALSVRPR